jgi:hypothetical protein
MLKRHIKDVHNNRKLYVCPKCNLTYKRSDSFSKHVESCNVEPVAVPSNEILSESVLEMSLENFHTHCTSLLAASCSNENDNQPHFQTSDELHQIIQIDVPEEVHDVSDFDTNNSPRPMSTDNEETFPFETLSDDEDQDENFPETDLSEIVFNIFLEDLRQLYKPKSSNHAFISRLMHLFDHNLCNYLFIRYLSKKLQIRYEYLVNMILRYDKDSASYGTRKRNPWSEEVRKKIYQFWLDNSIVTVDRRNGRDIVRIPKSRYDQINDLNKNPDDENITVEEKVFKKTGNVKQYVKAVKKIYTKSVRQLYRDYKSSEGASEVSLAVFFQMKPFYVVPPTEKEKLSCLCTTCLNIHVKLNVINKQRKSNGVEEVLSATEYVSCGLCENFSEKCLSGECDKPSCNRMPFEGHEAIGEEIVSYYYFGIVEEDYYDKSGTQKTYKRTSRIDVPSIKLSELARLTFDDGLAYLKHKIIVDNDREVFPLLRSNHTGIFLHMDFSENINLQEKLQVQSAHFSGKQCTLHCTVMEPPNPYKYIFHFSDDTSHDGAFVDLVMRDIMDRQGVTSGSTILVKTDNCKVQYKSRLPFRCYQNLCDDYGVNIVKTYGAPGHGKGLVDAMSSFGVKSPLRNAVVTKDMWFPTAESMVEYLSEEMSDKNHLYKFFSKEEVMLHRKACKRSLVIPGCSKIQLMYFQGAGEEIITQKKFCSCSSCINLKFGDCQSSSKIHGEDQDYNPELADEYQDDSEPCEMAVSEAIQPGSYIAIHTPSTSLEMFFLFSVLSVEIGTADTPKSDYGHNAEAGQRLAA